MIAAIDRQNQLDYLRQEKKNTSGSKALQKLFNMAENYLEDAEKAALDGRNVIWIQGWHEIPLAYSLGVIPVSFSEAGIASDQKAISISEDYFQMPVETCSMVKATMGEWYLRRNSPIKRITGMDCSCEPFNLAWEVMKREGYDVYTLDVIYRGPKVEGDRYEELVNHYVRELSNLTLWMVYEKETLNENKLFIEIKRKNEIMHKTRYIMKLRIKHPFYVKSLAVMHILAGVTHYFGKPEEFMEALDGLIEEMETLPENIEEKKDLIPLVWVGGRGQNYSVYDAIDKAGASLLGFVNTPYSKDYRIDIPPLESLARFVLDGQMAGASIYRQKVIEQEVEKINARGIILHGFLGCSHGSISNEMFRDHFYKRGVPSLNIEGTFQIGAPSGQMLTRIKAFIETLS